MLKQSSSRSLLAEGTSPKVRWHQNVNLEDEEEEEEEEGGAGGGGGGGVSTGNPGEVLEKQDTEVSRTRIASCFANITFHPKVSDVPFLPSPLRSANFKTKHALNLSYLIFFTGVEAWHRGKHDLNCIRM